MDVNTHNPQRGVVRTLKADGRHFATVEFICEAGGSVTMYFNDPALIREHAAALALLAEALEEDQEAGQ